MQSHENTHRKTQSRNRTQEHSTVWGHYRHFLEQQEEIRFAGGSGDGARDCPAVGMLDYQPDCPENCPAEK